MNSHTSDLPFPDELHALAEETPPRQEAMSIALSWRWPDGTPIFENEYAVRREIRQALGRAPRGLREEWGTLIALMLPLASAIADAYEAAALIGAMTWFRQRVREIKRNA